jgi:hypothetical protein
MFAALIDLDASSLMLMPQNAKGIPSTGEQLHVKTELNLVATFASAQ